MTVRLGFRTERDLRAYDLETETGEKLSIEETSEGTLCLRRGDKTSPEFVEALGPLLTHYIQYGNLPLPEGT